jgi:F-type H+-transporting ATPase subunit b
MWVVAALAGLAGAAPLLALAQEAKAKAGQEQPAEKTKADSGKAEEHAPASKAEEHAPTGKAEEHAPAGKAADAHAGPHHDDTDLGHGNATAKLTDPADFRFDMAIYSFLVFLILLAVLFKFAWGPIATALEQREETIARQIEEARLAAEKAGLQLKEYEARLAAATDEARQIVSQAKKDAELAKDRIVAEAREVAAKERDRAVSEITSAKTQALDEIAQRSVQTALSLAKSIIRREIKPQEHESLIGEAINEFSKLN